MFKRYEGGKRNAECGIGENVESGILDKGLGCRALRQLGRNREIRQIRESDGEVTARPLPQPLAIGWSGWPQAGRSPTGRVRSSVSSACSAGFGAGGFAVLSGTVSWIALGRGKSPEPPEWVPHPHGSGFQISHSEKFDIPHGQKRLAWVSQLTLYNASSRAPAAGPRLWAKPQPQRRRRPKRVGAVQRLLACGPAAAGPADTAALRRGPLRDRVGLQISHSERFDNSHAQKGLTWVSQLTLYNAETDVSQTNGPATAEAIGGADLQGLQRQF